jgi:hypothetical protein
MTLSCCYRVLLVFFVMIEKQAMRVVQEGTRQTVSRRIYSLPVDLVLSRRFELAAALSFSVSPLCCSFPLGIFELAAALSLSLLLFLPSWHQSSEELPLPRYQQSTNHMNKQPLLLAQSETHFLIRK